MTGKSDLTRRLRPGDVVEGQLCVASDVDGQVFRPLADVVADVKAGNMTVPLASNTHPEIRAALEHARGGVWTSLPRTSGAHKGFMPERTGTRGR